MPHDRLPDAGPAVLPDLLAPREGESVNTPRAPISVVRDPWCELDGYPWRAWCVYCGGLGERISWNGAMWDAEQHATEPCDGIVLARLLGRLRYRREGYERALRVTKARGDVHETAIYRMVIDNIDHDIRMASR